MTFSLVCAMSTAKRRTVAKHGLRDRQAFVALTQHTNASTICNNTIGATTTCLLSTSLPCHFCQHLEWAIPPAVRHAQPSSRCHTHAPRRHISRCLLLPRSRYSFRLSRTPRLVIGSFMAPRLKVYPVRTPMDKLFRQGRLATGINPMNRETYFGFGTQRAAVADEEIEITDVDRPRREAANFITETADLNGRLTRCVTYRSRPDS
jgi:hypothetical protein